jgi:PadR family transcriptional regulator PadR
MATDFTLIQGTLDVLILKTLTWGSRHGYAIARWIKDTSNESLDIEDRALYLALHRLEERGWVEAEWGVTGANRRARFYRLTTAGRRQLRAEIDRLRSYNEALFRVLDASSFGSRA